MRRRYVYTEGGKPLPKPVEVELEDKRGPAQLLPAPVATPPRPADPPGQWAEFEFERKRSRR